MSGVLLGQGFSFPTAAEPFARAAVGERRSMGVGKGHKYLQGKTFTVDSACCYEHLRCWGDLALSSSLEVLSSPASPSGHAEGDISPKARPPSHTPAAICPLRCGRKVCTWICSMGGKEQGPDPAGALPTDESSHGTSSPRSGARGCPAIELQLAEGPTPSQPAP